MSETLLTKCPHCGTTFRLTQAQLQIAGGAVRCGACYQVFHASEHIVKTAVVEEIRQPPPPQPDPIEEAFDIESEDGLDPYDAAEFSMDSPDADLFSEDYRKSFEPESSLDEFGLAETDVSKPKKGTDESWAEDLLKELGDDIEEEDDGLIHDEMDTGKRKSAISSSDNAFSLDDDAPRLAPAKKKKSGDDLSDTFRNLGSFASDDPFAITEIEEEEFEHGDPNDESWAKAMLEELEEEASPKAKPQGLSILLDDDTAPQAASPFAARELARDKREALERAKAQQKQQPKPAKKPVDKEAGKEKSLRNSETEEFFRLLDEPETPARSPKTEAAEPSLALRDLDNLDDLEDDLRDTAVEPTKLFKDADDIINQQIKISTLHFADEEPQSHTGRTVLMALGALLLILALAGQYLYFNLDTVARNPQLRPLLDRACGVLGCQVPSQVNLDAIAGTNLVVRSHPHEANALVIDAIIKNKAGFTQPFPAVLLSFDDVNGNPVASREFQPREYIHDPAVNLLQMPPDTPIHLTLEIVDPGRDAVNYQIQFRAAKVNP